jgi:hypothetical protein
MNVENESIGLLDRWKIGRSSLSSPDGSPRWPPAARLMDSERFAELLARNRGLNVRAFTDLEDARRWLLAGLRSGEPKPI